MDIRRDIGFIALRSYVDALRRGKTCIGIAHKERCDGIMEEMEELKACTGAPSEHLPQYTDVQEELADIILSGLTELVNTGADAGRVVIDKMEYNTRRADYEESRNLLATQSDESIDSIHP